MSEAAATSATYIVADVHWRPAAPDSPPDLGAFGAFLRELAHQAAGGQAVHLDVLGDLFEFWLERGSRVLPGYESHLAALKQASAAGVVIRVLFGNRDFTYGPAMVARTGVQVVGERAELAYGPQRVLLTHGDLFCTGDWRYQLFRRIIRSAPLRWLIRLVPFGRIERLVQGLRRASQREIQRKRPDSMGVVDAAVLRQARRGFSAVVCGHVHQPSARTLEGPHGRLQLITLGPWDAHGGWYAVPTLGGVVLRRYETGQAQGLAAP